VIKLRAPIKVEYEVTNACNLRCIFCGVSASSKLPRELSKDEAFSLLDELYDEGVFEIAFTGGEPFLRDDFIEILRHAIDIGLYAMVSTNGTLITKKIAYETKKAGLNEIQVSLHSGDPELERRLCGVNEVNIFDRKLKAIKNFVNNGINVQLFAVMTKQNYQYLDDFLNLALRMKGISAIVISDCLPFGRAASPVVPIGKKEWDLIIAKVKAKKRDFLEKGVDVYLQGHFYLCDADMMTKSPKPPIEMSHIFEVPGCKAGKMEVSIDAEGNVWPCKYLKPWPFFNAGNVRERSFKEIWETAQPILLFRERTPDRIRGVCRKCTWLTICAGGCPIMSFKETGRLESLFDPDPRCPFVQLHIKDLK
jgi:radical SAM protein with 4Fe4S-binding SPASM domain